MPLLFNALLTSADGFLLEKRVESARFLLDLCWVPAGTVLGAAASASKPGRRGGGFLGKPRRSFRWTRVIALLGAWMLAYYAVEAVATRVPSSIGGTIVG